MRIINQLSILYRLSENLSSCSRHHENIFPQLEVGFSRCAVAMQKTFTSHAKDIDEVSTNSSLLLWLVRNLSLLSATKNEKLFFSADARLGEYSRPFSSHGALASVVDRTACSRSLVLQGNGRCLSH